MYLFTVLLHCDALYWKFAVQSISCFDAFQSARIAEQMALLGLNCFSLKMVSI